MTFQTYVAVILQKTKSSADFNIMAEYFFIEMINLQDRLGKEYKTEEGQQINSDLTGLAWRCTFLVDRYYKC